MVKNIYNRIMGWNTTYQRLKKISVNDPNIIKKVVKAKIKPGKRIFILGTPIHSNLGDHIIALSEIKYLNDYFSDYELVDCIMPLAKYNFDILERSIQDKDILCISGGGWLGTKWTDDELFVRRVIQTFSNNPIIILPQTVFYDNEDSFLEEGKKIYAAHKKLLFCLRETASYDYVIRKGFVNAERTFLMPDFALLYKDYTIDPTQVRDGIGICFRDDIEKVLSTAKSCSIIETAKKISSIHMVSTLSEQEFISTDKREKCVKKKLDEISKYKLIITDRLHAMIMASITNTPCLAFNNATKKVYGVYDWIKELDYISLANNTDTYEKQIAILYNLSIKSSFDNLKLSDYEEKLHNKIHEIVNDVDDYRKGVS